MEKIKIIDMKIIKKIIIGGLFVFFGFVFPEMAKTAELYFLPQAGTLFVGETAIIELRLSADNKQVNAIDAAVKFNPEELEVKEFLIGGSEIDLWLEEPLISNSMGVARFSGGTSKTFPDNALLSRLMVKPKKQGFIYLNYEETSKVFEADGLGTSLKLDFFETIYKISEKPAGYLQAFSRSHPNTDRWYPGNILEIGWDEKEDFEYSYLISRDFGLRPDDEPEEIVGDIEYAGLTDGIYYFRLREKKDGGEWRDAADFRAMIDANPPEFSETALSRRKGFLDDEISIYFSASDIASGVDYYKVCEDEKICVEAASPYVAVDQFFGKKIIIKVVDKVGHEAQKEIKLPFTFPIYFIAILICALTVIAVGICLKLKQK